MTAMFVNGSERYEHHYRGPLIYTFYHVSVHLAKRFQRRRFIFKLPNQKQELPIAVMCVNGSGRYEQSL
jgi:IS4 transposase